MICVKCEFQDLSVFCNENFISSGLEKILIVQNAEKKFAYLQTKIQVINL